MRILIEPTKAVIVSHLAEQTVSKGSRMFGDIVPTERLGDILGELAARELQKREIESKLRYLKGGSAEGVEDSVEDDPRAAERRLWKLNRKELFRRAYAYASLNESFRFLAFYSVSFPAGMEESVVCRVWNKILTRWRRDCGLKSYVWVAERQSNGTRHYHLLTNNWMRIQDCNKIAAVSIDGEVAKGTASWGNSSLSLYNGVDVKRVRARSTGVSESVTSSMVRQVTRYITKYISKSSNESAYRLWHCSRNVSALVVRASVEEADFVEAVSNAEAHGSRVRVWKCEYANVVLCDLSGEDVFRFYVSRVNNVIWDYLRRRGLA